MITDLRWIWKNIYGVHYSGSHCFNYEKSYYEWCEIYKRIVVFIWNLKSIEGVNFSRITGARLDAHPIWRTTNATGKHGAISPILQVFCRYYVCDAIMLIKPSMVRSWATGKTPLDVAIVILNFAWDARMNTVNVFWMRERIKQDARTSLLMRERTHIVRVDSFYQHGLVLIPA